MRSGTAGESGAALASESAVWRFPSISADQLGSAAAAAPALLMNFLREKLLLTRLLLFWARLKPVRNTRGGFGRGGPRRHRRAWWRGRQQHCRIPDTLPDCSGE